jgi:hypothetical protein
MPNRRPSYRDLINEIFDVLELIAIRAILLACFYLAPVRFSVTTREGSTTRC